MPWLANIVYFVGALLYLPVLLYQMLVQRKNRRGWRQRFGHWPIRPSTRPRIWLHAVSLGEINATPLLVRRLESALPDHEVIISTTTDTGYARACQLYGEQRVFRFPLDFTWVVNRVLNRVQPAMIVLIELEVWFNLVHAAHQRRIPIAVVNGRLTERSRRRLGWIAGPARAMFSRLTWVGAQDEAIAARFRELATAKPSRDEPKPSRDRKGAVVPGASQHQFVKGADRAGTLQVETTGSIKWDSTTVADHIEGQEALAKAVGITEDSPVWVCGSTGPDEEAIILEAYAKMRQAGVTVKLVLVPRKPERFDEVADLIRRAGHPCTRRSRHPDQATPQQPAESVAPTNTEAPTEAVAPANAVVPTDAVVLGDTMGELRKFYSLADVVFVGRSLVPMGGSDPMEVAALAKPIITGPHMENFREPAAALSQKGALITVNHPDQLAEAVTKIIRQPQQAQESGANARQVVKDNQGATDRTIDRLLRLMR